MCVCGCQPSLAHRLVLVARHGLIEAVLVVLEARAHRARGHRLPRHRLLHVPEHLVEVLLLAGPGGRGLRKSTSSVYRHE